MELCLFKFPQNTFLLPIIVLRIQLGDCGTSHIHKHVGEHLASSVEPTVRVVAQSWFPTSFIGFKVIG
jgi:hypothetical protein